MTRRLVEGQSFPPHFTLLGKLDDAAGEAWLALNELTGDRVVLTLLTEPVSASAWASITTRLDAMRGLIHESIGRVLDYG